MKYISSNECNISKFQLLTFQNIFSIVRSKNGFNDRPEYTAFYSAIRAVGLSNLLKPIGSNGNCEVDKDGLLVDVLEEQSLDDSVVSKSGISALLDPEVSVSESEEDVLSGDEEESLQRSELEVLDYIGGYIVTRLARQEKMKCTECRHQLVRQNFRGVLVQEKDFVQDAAQKAALAASSPSLKTFLTTAEKIASHYLEGSSHLDRIGYTIRKCILDTAPALQCCHPFEAASVISTLFLRVQLHHHSRLFNEKLHLSRKQYSKCRKMKKWALQYKQFFLLIAFLYFCISVSK